ncbi:MAG TPA: hypothetical protein VGL57_08185 [Solirubrobacteraceae bacterium]|jgi:hypothetical protein
MDDRQDRANDSLWGQRRGIALHARLASRLVDRDGKSVEYLRTALQQTGAGTGGLDNEQMCTERLFVQECKQRHQRPPGRVPPMPSAASRDYDALGDNSQRLLKGSCQAIFGARE